MSPPARRVLCAPDKFAGALTAAQAARAMAEGVAEAGGVPVILPIADGGEGSFDVLDPAEVTTVPCEGPLGRATRGRIGRLPDGRAFVESADACGLSLLRLRRPALAHSRGLGQVLRVALERCDHVVVGLGGTATVDLGAGLAQALGVVLLDALGRPLPPLPSALGQVTRISLPDLRPWRGRVTAWCDVAAPLWGEGITGRSFLLQKGVDDPDAIVQGWQRLVEAMAGAGLRVDPTAPGAGAAGGLGLMLAALLEAPLLPGADAVLDAVGFDARLGGVSHVLTGEGRFDRQSLAGKGPGRVITRARAAGLPVTVLAGAVEVGMDAGPGVGVLAISDPALPLPEQLRQSAVRLRAAAREVVSSLSRSLP